ncbi:tetratricopeptide repeat protein [Aestuariivirga litoralis]|uniref:tetratricopeptide repeat protein n=1 Tax=Aestuariivirga litoralis TaxID=2650924 RepID=UPI001AEE40FF|nr:tetratricopeptide repeat protein [Aestuariivirga litoralis]MBG1232778.1 tetratricopeptide repeat protein [Aestuariivirga litoralis]
MLSLMSVMRFSVQISAIVFLALAASGCVSHRADSSADQLTTGSTSPAMAPAPNTGPAGSYLGTRKLADDWAAHPGDEKIGLAYAAALGKLGQQQTQIDVLKAVSVAHPSDAGTQASIGKALLAANRPGEAAAVLERAVATGRADWKTYSALGSAYDAQGQYDMARAQYGKALQLQPGALSVQNNLGMSYALQGNLPQAEKVLRVALAQNGSATEPRIRQNLALVVGLSGRFDEARKIASADLPPDQVEANLAFLQDMLNKPNTWAQLQNQNTTAN